MNRLNAKRLQVHNAVVKEVPGQLRSHIEIILANRRSIGLGGPPIWSESDKFTADTAGLTDPLRMEFIEDDPASFMVIRSLMPAAALGNAIELASRDKTLSDVGRRERVAAVAADALRVIGEQGAALERQRQIVTGLESTLFDAPLTVPDGDFATLLADREIRDHYRGADEATRSALLQKIVGDRDARLIAALMRSPLPLAERDAPVVRDTWRSIITEHEPDKAQAWKRAAENVEWAQHVISAVAPVAVELSGLTPFEVYRAAAPNAAVYRFTTADKAEFEQRIAASSGTRPKTDSVKNMNRSAFDALRPPERTAFMRDGGQLTN